MKNNNFEKDYYESVKGTSEFDVPFADGTTMKGDPGFIFYVADIIASEYGLGGHKSLSGFIKMIDEADPVVIDGFMTYIAKRHQAQNSDEKEKPENFDKEEYIENDDKLEKSNSLEEVAVPNSVDNTVVKEMLFRFGVKKADLKSAMDKVDERKIATLKDYSYLSDGKNLENMPEEEFRKVLASLKEERKGSVNFNVSIETLMNKEREQLG